LDHLRECSVGSPAVRETGVGEVGKKQVCVLAAGEGRKVIVVDSGVDGQIAYGGQRPVPKQSQKIGFVAVLDLECIELGLGSVEHPE